MVKEVVTDRLRVNIDIENEKSDDNRSYHINSDKIFKMLNFKPKHSIKDAINSLLDAFDKKNGDFSFLIMTFILMLKGCKILELSSESYIISYWWRRFYRKSFS